MEAIQDHISRLSARSLLIGICNEFREEPFAYATGFIVRTPIGPCLFTARHCVTGIHHYSGKNLDKNASKPFSINIFHRTLDENGCLTAVVIIKGESLYDTDDRPRWYEHPKYADCCDFVCLPLRSREDCGIIQVYTDPCKTEFSKLNGFTDDSGFAINAKDNMHLHVSDQISVIGYPFGAMVGNIYPLWATGHLSSEPYLHTSFGVGFIDCRTRGGQSGSPVYAVRAGAYESIGGDGMMFDGYAYMFIGLYSGRIRKDSDVGIIWKASVIHETAMSMAGSTSANSPTNRKISGPITYMPTLADTLKAQSDC